MPENVNLPHYEPHPTPKGVYVVDAAHKYGKPLLKAARALAKPKAHSPRRTHRKKDETKWY